MPLKKRSVQSFLSLLLFLVACFFVALTDADAVAVAAPVAAPVAAAIAVCYD